jgi:hypothetical protein
MLRMIRLTDSSARIIAVYDSATPPASHLIERIPVHLDLGLPSSIHFRMTAMPSICASLGLVKRWS